MTKKNETTVSIPEIGLAILRLTLEGRTSLISHAWGEKTRKMMLEKQTGAARQKKAAKDPQADYQASLYPMPGEEGVYAFPSSGLKRAAVSACRFVEGIPMTRAKGSFFVVGEWVRINGSPTMREDIVMLNSGMKPVPDIRFRGEFKKWSMDLEIEYNTRAISPAQIINLFNNAGFGVGIGDWRPEKNGDHGRFCVKADAPPTKQAKAGSA